VASSSQSASAGAPANATRTTFSAEAGVFIASLVMTSKRTERSAVVYVALVCGGRRIGGNAGVYRVSAVSRM